MGSASKAISIVFRIGELISASIVLGIMSRFIYLVNLGHADTNSRLIYAEVIAGISIAASILLMPPLLYSFWAFPLDCALFICWMVAFGLLANLSGSHTCSSFWYWNYWGYYWGRFWYIPRATITYSVVGNVGCGPWRSVLAFSFIGGICWLVNTFIGFYVAFMKWYDKRHLVQKNGTAVIPREKPDQTQAPADVGAVP